jgi:hypothetical protein
VVHITFRSGVTTLGDERGDNWYIEPAGGELKPGHPDGRTSARERPRWVTRDQAGTAGAEEEPRTLLVSGAM